MVDLIDGGTIDLAGKTLPVEIRIDSRARRLILRVARPNTIRVTCPSKRHVRDALKMVSARREWIARRLKETPTPIPFAPGIILPIFGKPTPIVKDENTRRAARIEADQLVTGGTTPKAITRRVETALRKLMLNTCQKNAQQLAATLGVEVNAVTVRQMTSRWGSCTHDGNVCFNWRLVFAPPTVLHYVVAHEIAHLKHMDHSAAFWSVVETLDPDYQIADQWLRDHGAGLHAYGEEEAN
ncbi:MAG: SprT family zinc-dependent metalloprotease [Pseudomonadota bacterium]